jgi:plastocyanin
MKRLAVLLALFAFAGALPAQAAAPLSRVQVVAFEFHYRLSRVRVPAGPVRVELANFGQDEHNLQLRRVGTSKRYELPSALSGERRTTTLKLKPGLYVLKCTLADHAARGMKAHLRVRARTPLTGQPSA